MWVQGYRQSLVPVRMAVHCVEAAQLDDIWDPKTMVNAFMKYKGQKLKISLILNFLLY